jgi:NIPSNAP
VSPPPRSPTDVRDPDRCAIVELRQYTLHPGTRDVLIDLFDREFVESQEALGMSVIGQFRDLDDPDRFVWLRGFPDMPSRARRLEDFYGGPVWKAHRDVANATMVAFDDVLLLRPARAGSGFRIDPGVRPPPGADELPKSLVVANVHDIEAHSGDEFADFFERELRPVVTRAGAEVLASFVTENSANNYPALPVREGEEVFVWFSRFESEADYERYAAELAGSRQWREASKKLEHSIEGRPDVLKLSPTARSLVR